MSETQTTTHNAAAVPTDTTPAAEAPAATGPSFLGDSLLPGAEMVYDQRRAIRGSPEDIWPWVVQWGKGRGGWYVPAKFEKVLPEKFRSAPTINPQWQTLNVGDRVPDYGLGNGKSKSKDKKKQKKNNQKRKDDDDEYYLEVAIVDNQRALVYKGERMGMSFTWALLLENSNGTLVEPAASSARSANSDPETVLHLRFRGQPQQSGWKSKVAVQVGKVADGVMASAMFPGIVDRVEQQDRKEK